MTSDHLQVAGKSGHNLRYLKLDTYVTQFGLTFFHLLTSSILYTCSFLKHALDALCRPCCVLQRLIWACFSRLKQILGHTSLWESSIQQHFCVMCCQTSTRPMLNLSSIPNPDTNGVLFCKDPTACTCREQSITVSTWTPSSPSCKIKRHLADNKNWQSKSGTCSKIVADQKWAAEQRWLRCVRDMPEDKIGQQAILYPACHDAAG